MGKYMNCMDFKIKVTKKKIAVIIKAGVLTAVFLCALVSFIGLNKTEARLVRINQPAIAEYEKPTLVDIEIQEDSRFQKLSAFLEKKNSPLKEHADLLVQKADENELDWRLLAAISGIESNFGKVQLTNSYNAWGWGGGYIYFDSWEDAIVTISDSLGERWAKKGGRDYWQLSKSYCPPNWEKWSLAVGRFMGEISNVEI